MRPIQYSALPDCFKPHLFGLLDARWSLSSGSPKARPGGGHDSPRLVTLQDRTPMHDIKWIRENAHAFDAALKRRGLEPLSAKLILLDQQRRSAIVASELAQARRNSASKEIGEAKKAKDEARAAALMTEVAELKTTLPRLEAAAKAADEGLNEKVANI